MGYVEYFGKSFLEAGWGAVWEREGAWFSACLSQPLLIFSDSDKWVEWMLSHMGTEAQDNWLLSSHRLESGCKLRFLCLWSLSSDFSSVCWVCSQGCENCESVAKCHGQVCGWLSQGMQGQDLIIKLPPTHWSFPLPPPSCCPGDISPPSYPWEEKQRIS